MSSSIKPVEQFLSEVFDNEEPLAEAGFDKLRQHLSGLFSKTNPPTQQNATPTPTPVAPTSVVQPKPAAPAANKRAVSPSADATLAKAREDRNRRLNGDSTAGSTDPGRANTIAASPSVTPPKAIPKPNPNRNAPAASLGMFTPKKETADALDIATVNMHAAASELPTSELSTQLKMHKDILEAMVAFYDAIAKDDNPTARAKSQMAVENLVDAYKALPGDVQMKSQQVAIPTQARATKTPAARPPTNNA